MAPKQKPWKILVIDDETDMCEALKTNLEMRGRATVETCTQSTQAMEHVRRLKPNLILLDVLMPGLWGTDIAQRLRAQAETQAIPIIFVTALDAPDEKAKLLLGEKYVLRKPFPTQALLSVIEAAFHSIPQSPP